MNINRKKNAGMTLVETLMALFILSITITSAYAVILANLASANAVKNSFIASGLAQEGIEVARNLRDSDWLDSPAREFGSFGDPSGAPIADGTYCVEWNSTQLLSSGCDATLFRSATGMYSYDDSGTLTPFTRAITITHGPVLPTGGVAEVIVTVTVSWDERQNSKQLSAEEHLFNWY